MTRPRAHPVPAGSPARGLRPAGKGPDRASDRASDAGERVRDHRSGPRRRGPALDAAILEAALEELREVGYARLTMERVAERARASKASLYRRWPDRARLVVDVIHHLMPGHGSPPDTGSLRGDVLTMLRQTAVQLEGEAGQALRGLLSELLQDPDTAAEIRRYGRGNSAGMLREIIARAAARGECDPAAVTDRRIEAGPAMVFQRFAQIGRAHV